MVERGVPGRAARRAGSRPRPFGRPRLRFFAAAALAGCLAAPPGRDAAAPEAPRARPAKAGEASGSPSERLQQRVAARRGDAPTAPVVDLPLERIDSGHLIVPARSQGRELRLILDTGASTSVLTPEAGVALGIGPDAGIAVEAAGAGGEVANVRLVELEQLDVGDRSYRALSVALMDLSHLQAQLGEPVDGLLGRNFLMRNDVEIDFAAARLRMFPPGAIEGGALPVEGLQAVDFGEFPAGLMRLDLRLDDAVDVQAVFDLGAARSVLNWRAAEAAGVRRADAKRLAAGESLVGADERATATSRHRFAGVAVGGLHIAEPNLHIADLQVFETLGVANGPAMVFGVDLIDDRRLVIDYGGHRIYFSAAAAADGG